MSYLSISLFVMVSLMTHPFSCKAFMRLGAGRKAWKVDRASLRGLSSITVEKVEVPVTPKSFGEEFSISSDSTSLILAQRNKHVLDVKIQFDEGPHEYFFEGKKMSLSVTGLVDSFFAKFDPDTRGNRRIPKAFSGGLRR